MRRISSMIALAVLLISLAKADDVMTGDKADRVKQEIVRLELDKVASLLKNGSVAADWIASHDSDDIVDPSSDGVSMNSKAETIAEMRSGKLFLISQKESGRFVDVYGDGKVAICTYYADSVFRRDGNSVPVKTANMDAWSKFPDGAWRRVVHDVFIVSSIPTQ